MSGASWLDQLEARLEQQLETFLRANPAQDALLQDQEARDRQALLVGQRRQLQRQAEQERQALLQLAGEIRRWQERVGKARTAGATALAERAEAHHQELMQQGRRRWQQLAELGVRFAVVERELQELQTATASASTGDSSSGSSSGSSSSLEKDWAAFEADQALEQLRRRQG